MTCGECAHYLFHGEYEIEATNTDAPEGYVPEGYKLGVCGDMKGTPVLFDGPACQCWKQS